MKKNSHSTLFLIELIIAILFFSLGSALCIQVFLRAHLVSKSARDLSFASAEVSSAASVLKYKAPSLESLKEFFPSVQEDQDSFFVCYDSDYQFCENDSRAYQLTIQTSVEGNQENAHIWMTDDQDKLLYELQLRYPAD